MDYNAYYAEVAAFLAFLVMSVRLHRKGVRSHGLPERFLSAAFLFWALGYLLWDLPYALTDDASQLSLFSFAGRVAIHLGTIALSLFIRSVFRPRARWALWLVFGTALGLLAGAAGSAWVGDWLGDRPFSDFWYWPELAANIVPSAWMAWEGMIAYESARKRRSLGLCSPLLCNRFLLWGLAGAVWSMLEIVALAQEIELTLTGRGSDLTDIFSGACQFIPAVLMWLAFFPPDFYRNRVARHGENPPKMSAVRNR
jgi:hypothetical protein